MVILKLFNCFIALVTGSPKAMKINAKLLLEFCNVWILQYKTRKRMGLKRRRKTEDGKIEKLIFVDHLMSDSLI
jgi:hypothetical protein